MKSLAFTSAALRSTAWALVFCLCGFSSAVGQNALPDAVRAFDEGTVHLLDGNFQSAISLFEVAEQSGWSSPELFYNMGLAFHRMNKLGLAITYLERAKQLAPEDPKIAHSLTVANHKQVDRFSQLPDPFWKKLHTWSARVVPVHFAFWFGFALWVGFVALMVGKIVLAWRGDWWRRSRIVIGTLACILIVHALATSAWPPTQERAVIVATELRLRANPDDTADEVIRVHEGLVVKVEERTTDWAMIELPNGTKGWVALQAFVSI